MTSVAIHKAHIEEHLHAIDGAIAVGVEQRPATIGLHVSAGAISLLELYLHVLDKITIGSMIKHEWFKEPKPEQKIAPLAERKIPVEFPAKEELFSLMYIIEERRNKLIYGKPSVAAIEEILKAFQKLHDIIKKKLEERGESLA